MGKVVEHTASPPSIGSLTERIVKRLNPEGYIEFQLRQTVSDAIRELGKDKVREILKDAAE